jgi:hypothetical protein
MIAGALLLLLLTADAGEFARHPAEAGLTKKAAAPKLVGKARRYRTVLREEAAQPPNFNGHYRLALLRTETLHEP